MDARVPVTAQRVPMAAGMPGPIPHNMGSNAPPPARPVKQLHLMSLSVLSVWLWFIYYYYIIIYYYILLYYEISYMQFKKEYYAHEKVIFVFDSVR